MGIVPSLFVRHSGLAGFLLTEEPGLWLIVPFPSGHDAPVGDALFGIARQS